MVGKLAPESEIIPVWTTECEEHDGSHDGLCAGVGCFKGICWQAYTEQLSLVDRKAKRVGVLLPYRDFRRDDSRYGAEAGWILHALKSFQVMPPRHGGKAIQPARLVAVLQGWDVTAEQVTAQIERTRVAGAGGYILSEVKIDQSWSPILVDRAQD
jgi:hypothetical protein